MTSALPRSQLEPKLVSLIAGLRQHQVQEAMRLLLDYIDASRTPSAMVPGLTLAEIFDALQMAAIGLVYAGAEGPAVPDSQIPAEALKRVREVLAKAGKLR